MTSVAYCIDHMGVGGAQRHLLQVLSRLDRQLYQPSLWVATSGGALEPAVRALDVPVRSLEVRGRVRHPRPLARLLWMAGVLRWSGVRVVHGYMSLGNLLGALAGRLGGVPVVIASKRSLDEYPRRWELAAVRVGNRLADAVIANATAVAEGVERVEGYPAAKVRIIPNGVDVPGGIDLRAVTRERERLDIGPGEPVIGSVGRLAWKKDYETLIDAVALLVERHRDLRLVVLGDGPLARALAERATARGLRRHVCFTGERNEAAPLLALFDVFVLSSVVEGMSNALLEALAMGKPVVVTSVGGNPEVVRHERTGLVVPPRDPAALAAAVDRLLADRDRARRLAEAGREDVRRRFSTAQMIKRLEGLYAELLRAKGEPVQMARAA